MQSSLAYAGAVPTGEALDSRKILYVILSATETQCSISSIYSDIDEYFGLVAMTRVAQLKTAQNFGMYARLNRNLCISVLWMSEFSFVWSISGALMEAGPEKEVHMMSHW